MVYRMYQKTHFALRLVEIEEGQMVTCNSFEVGQGMLDDWVSLCGVFLICSGQCLQKGSKQIGSD